MISATDGKRAYRSACGACKGQSSHPDRKWAQTLRLDGAAFRKKCVWLPDDTLCLHCVSGSTSSAALQASASTSKPILRLTTPSASSSDSVPRFYTSKCRFGWSDKYPGRQHAQPLMTQHLLLTLLDTYESSDASIDGSPRSSFIGPAGFFGPSGQSWSLSIREPV